MMETEQLQTKARRLKYLQQIFMTRSSLINLQEYPCHSGFQVRRQYTMLLAYVQPPENWTRTVHAATYRAICDSHSCPAYKITFTPLSRWA